MCFRLLLVLSIAAILVPGQARQKMRERRQAMLQQQRERRTITVDGVERAYTVVQPLTRPAAIPIVLVFHAPGTNPDAGGRLARQELIVYPEGHGGTWSERAPDVGFIGAVIDELLKSDTALDRTRVYAVGAGGGGLFAQRLGCELNSRIAAVVSIGAPTLALLKASCKAPDAIPVMLIGGTPDSFEFWRKQNGCTGEAVKEPHKSLPGVEMTAMKTCRDGAEVVQAQPRGTRVWPPGASAEVMEFLTRFRRTPRF